MEAPWAEFEANATEDFLPAAYPWYERADYERIRELVIDREFFLQDYDQWRGQAERAFDRIRANGTNVVRTVIDPEGFLQWCREHGWSPDSAARLAYAELTLLKSEA